MSINLPDWKFYPLVPTIDINEFMKDHIVYITDDSYPEANDTTALLIHDDGTRQLITIERIGNSIVTKGAFTMSRYDKLYIRVDR